MPILLETEKRPPDSSMDHIEAIVDQIKTIDPKRVAEETINWLTRNVENYVDNTTNYYKIDLIIDNEDLPETRKAQNLYRECGDIYDVLVSDSSIKTKSKNKLAKLEECRKILDEMTAEAFFAMKEDRKSLLALFKRIIFFYEKIIPNPEAKKRANEIDAELKALVEEKERAETTQEKSEIQARIIEKIDEGVALVRFTELEGAVDVTKFEYEAFSLDVRLSKKNDGGGKDELKQYKIEEGFTVWLEISQRPKMKRPVSMF